MRFVLCPLQAPDLGVRVFHQIEDLILLVTPRHIQRSGQRSPPLLLHQQGAVGTPQQAGGAGDHLKAVPGGLLSRVVDSQDTDTVLVGKQLELPNHIVVVGIAVGLAADLSNLLHGVNDDELGVRVLLNKVRKLLIQPGAQLACRRSEEQVSVSFTPYIMNIRL